MKHIVPVLLIGLLLVGCAQKEQALGIAADEATPTEVQPAQPPSPTPAPIVNIGPTKWEYKLDTTLFDAECATEALASQQNEESIRSAVELFGYSHYTMGNIWQSESCYGRSLPNGVFDKIMSDYVACGQQAFDTYAGGMGEAGWEMVSYSRMQYTTPGSQYCSAVVTDYGYEIMWKRSKMSDD
ncbi:MAG: hypothetical protein KC547_17120 [Anaerolineae bacterium]|nr:hypothetical protein [Anaerolineae bacterium]